MALSIEEIVLASTNRGKLAELEAMLAGRSGRLARLRVLSLADFEPVEPAVEDGATLEENARRKALHYARLLGRVVLADDSGLEVDALNGAPGVYSARFAEVDARDRRRQDEANNRKLLDLLEGTQAEQRTARFHCCLCLARTGEVLLEAQGRLEGRIATTPRGSGGFGYDPVFFAPEAGKMVAELAAPEKNALSHRGRALRELSERLEQLVG